MSERNFAREQDAQLAAEYMAGATYRELAAKHGGTDTSVRSAVLRGGAISRPPAPRSRWSEDSEQEALAMYRSGHSVKKVAAHFGCRSTVITEFLEAHDVVLHPGGRAHPKFRTREQCEPVARDYESGDSLAVLAEKYHCTTPTIANAIVRGGGALRPGGTPKTWTDDVIAWTADSYQSGASQQAIADHLGVSQTAVSRQLRLVGAIARAGQPRREGHHSWQGGRVAGPGGYILILPTDDDLTFCQPNSSGYVPEHRLAMGRALGRKLRKTETVHHISGDKTDNRLENLQLRQGRHGKGVVMTCNSCGSHDVVAMPIADDPDIEAGVWPDH